MSEPKFVRASDSAGRQSKLYLDCCPDPNGDVVVRPGVEQPLFQTFNRFLIETFSESLDNLNLSRNTVGPDHGAQQDIALGSGFNRFGSVFRGASPDNLRRRVRFS